MKEKIINAIFAEYDEAIKAYYAAYNKAEEEEKAARKAKREEINTIFMRTDAEKHFYNRCRKVAEESMVNAVYNVVIETMKEDPETWTKYPVHYKRFEALTEKTFGGTVHFYKDRFGNTEIYIRNDLIPHERNYIRILYGDDLTPENIAELKTKPVMKLDEIEQEVKTAIEERTAFFKAYEETKKALEAKKQKYNNFWTLYEIFPYIESIPEYKTAP
jgi:hypothetical protein